MRDDRYKPIGKRLEDFIRRLRPHLKLRYRRAFAGMVARGLSQHRVGEPIVCCDIANPAIDSVGGRYYFSLVRDLIDAGYFPVFTAHRSTLSTFGTSTMKSSLLNERLGVIGSLQELKEPFFLITDQDVPPPANARMIVRIRYERRLCQSVDEVAFPVFVHPWLAATVHLPYAYDVGDARPSRVFFGGNTEEGKYNKDILRDIYGMLTRREMLTVACFGFPVTDIHRPRDASAWLSSSDIRPFVLCETQHCKIPQERWLDALAKADFFLACPGVGMPLCHNLIEALAAGAIPILQYAAYLPHPLEHGVNCLSFTDRQTLAEVIHAAVSMKQEEIRKMRENVRRYYDQYLAPGRFSSMLLGGELPQKKLLLNAYRVPR